MWKIFKTFIFLSVFFFIFAGETSAYSYVAESSGELKSNFQVEQPDERVLILTRFLYKYKSPLTPFVNDIIFYSDFYGIDYRLVPAISGVESTFGKFIPQGSYNAYGWASGAYYFQSWQDSIRIVSMTLREKYLDAGATNIYSIAKRYAPPSTTWARNVIYFMNKIENKPIEYIASE